MAKLDLSNTHNTAEVEGKGRRITLVDEQGEPYMADGEPITALIAGTYSKRFTAAQAKANEAAARKPGRRSAEEREATTMKGYAACIIEWDLEIGGKSADPETIFKLKPHIYEQIITEANSHADFFSALSTS